MTIENSVMEATNDYEVIIAGGSYAGLSAAMCLGRAIRRVLVIDSGAPCNAQTPYSHNVITLDGVAPGEIRRRAKEQVLAYPTITFTEGLVTAAEASGKGFAVTLASGDRFTAGRLLFATGVKNRLPAIPGFRECWGISVLHCPYCHGYEVRDKPTGIFGNGEAGFEMARLLSQWTRELTVFTNGKADFSAEQIASLSAHGIGIEERPVSGIIHAGGYLSQLRLEDGTLQPLTALYARLPFEQHCDLPVQLGCAVTEEGLLKVDLFGQTSVPGILAAGDNTSLMRSVTAAIAAGNMAGAFINRDLTNGSF